MHIVHVVTVRYFARLKEVTGTASEKIALDPGSTIQDLITRLICKYPALIDYQRSLLVASNAEYVDNNAVVAEGDVVDVMPPVSGG